jgi:hypothetical protein
MRGVVRAINRGRGMVGIWVEERGGHTIIEMLSSHDIQLGDLMAWNAGTSMGGNTYQNLTKGWSAEVYVQNHDVSSSNLRRQLLVQG